MCAPAVAFILRLAPLDYMPDTLRTTTYQAMYQRNLPMIDIASLELEIDPNDRCLAPSTRTPRGRPKKRRIRTRVAPLDLEIQPRHHCSTCQQPGHNARSCRQLHN